MLVRIKRHLQDLGLSSRSSSQCTLHPIAVILVDELVADPATQERARGERPRTSFFRTCARKAGSPGRKVMIDPAHKCPVQRQCASVGLSRSAYYYRSRGPSLECRRMLAAAVALHREQPSAPNRVWASDLTQLQVSSGLMHAAVIIDLNARLVVGCRLSNTADTELCLNALADACRVYGCPAIFHSDKGSQFTSRSFRSELRSRGINPSMTGRRDWKCNVEV